MRIEHQIRLITVPDTWTKDVECNLCGNLGGRMSTAAALRAAAIHRERHNRYE